MSAASWSPQPGAQSLLRAELFLQARNETIELIDHGADRVGLTEIDAGPLQLLHRIVAAARAQQIEEAFRRGGGPLRDFLSDILLSGRARKRGVFRPEAVENLLLKEKNFGRQLWGLLCLELWYRAFVDGERLRPLAIAGNAVRSARVIEAGSAW